MRIMEEVQGCGIFEMNGSVKCVPTLTKLSIAIYEAMGRVSKGAALV
jgi:hypothetical protein